VISFRTRGFEVFDAPHGAPETTLLWRGLAKTFPFQLPTRVEFGPGAARRIGEEAARLGRRPLLVTDPGVVSAGVVDPLLTLLRESHLDTLTYSDVEANPRAATVDATAAAGREHGADMVIAVGGGSALDTAKGAAAVITHGGAIFDYEGVDRVPGPTVPVIAVPTTAGTGSEVTAWSIVTDTARHYKMAVGGAFLSPRLALVDPELTLSLPPTPTAMTGADALTHAIEAFTARCSNPISDALALYAIELIALQLEAATADGSNLEARSAMLLGSLIAGIAFANADTAAVHAMAEALGGVFDVPHGVANAVCLPYVMTFNLEAVPEKTARIGRAMGLSTLDLPVKEAAEAAVEEVRGLLRRLGTPSLRDLGVTETDIPLLVSIAMMNTGNIDNPVEVDEESFTMLFHQALTRRTTAVPQPEGTT
jgi:alcohol dehydrogenase